MTITSHHQVQTAPVRVYLSLLEYMMYWSTVLQYKFEIVIL